MPKHQIIRDTNGAALYALVPFDEYMDMTEGAFLTDEEAFLQAVEDDDGTAPMPDAVLGRLLDGENPIKVYREWRGLTQEQLAQQAQVNRLYISQLETGNRNPSRKLLAKLAEILNCDLDELE